MAKADIYGGKDPRDLPAYSVPVAARIVRLPATTLRSWVRGRSYPTKAGPRRAAPVIVPPTPTFLSFTNLVEAHVLAAMRREHALTLETVRAAVPLLRYILGSARIPEGAPRVAISLDHPDEGPFLVVTREGRFVTCLGAGMSSGDLPVITRGQLDAIAAKRDDLRGRIADAIRMGGPNGGAGKMLRRIREAGDELAREEIAAIIGLQPLYAAQLVRTLVGAGTDLLNAREILLRELKHSDRLKPHFREALRVYWRSFWALGHLSVLVGQDGPAMINRLPS